MAICVVPKYNTFKKERKKERNVKDSWSGMKSAAQTLIMYFHSYTTTLFMLAAIFLVRWLESALRTTCFSRAYHTWNQG